MRVKTISERFEDTLKRYNILEEDLLEDLLLDVVSWQIDVKRQMEE